MAARSSFRTESTRTSQTLGDGGFLYAHGELAVVFMAAEFALDGHMGASGKVELRDQVPGEVRSPKIEVSTSLVKADLKADVAVPDAKLAGGTYLVRM